MRKFLGTAVILLALLLVWQAVHLMAGDSAMSSPWATVLTLVQMLGTHELWVNILETGKALGYALVLGLLGGLLLGIVLGVHRLSGSVVEPILLNLYAVPKVTLYPLVLLIFGLGLSAKVAFGVMHGVIPIVMFTMNAIRQMRPVHLRASRTLHLSPRQTILHVVLPAILPEVISGLRLGFSLTLLGVLIGEMFASQRGLGYLITTAMGLGNISTIMAIALLLTIFAVTCNGLLMFCGRRLGHR